MKAPCENCPVRHVGCHDRCDEYQYFRRVRERISKARFDEKEIDNAVIEIGHCRCKDINSRATKHSF